MGVQKNYRPTITKTGRIVSSGENTAKVANPSTGVAVITLTQAQFDALIVKDPNILYIIASA